MSYTHLTPQDRYVISHLRVAGFSLREIGRKLGRSHTTICRELKRNSPEPGGVYWYFFIEKDIQRKRHKPRSFRRQQHEPLVDYVEKRLRAQWPPEAIANRIRMDYPDDDRMRISHETIYRWIYLDAQQGGTLFQLLRRRHRWRRRQKRYGAGRRFIPDRISIHERPAEVEDRSRFGDWEGDLVVGSKNRSAAATLVERKSRFLLAACLPDKKADSFNHEAVQLFKRLPQSWRQTLTLDNGSEFSQFKELEKQTGLNVYFADPYAAWQRGANENTNGLLRQFFPKGTDFTTVDEGEMNQAVQRLNHRPRKCLGYRTPFEVMRENLGGALAT